jgi:hypothetical protein
LTSPTALDIDSTEGGSSDPSVSEGSNKMNTKWFAVLTVICIGIFTASPAVADMGDLAYDKVQALAATHQNAGNTSGTILNPEGRGDLLIFPYYDVREINGKTQDFLFTIVNNEWDPCEGLSLSTQCYDGVAAKLRFREWDKGEEVFSTDIWLSRGDVWVGVITHNSSIALPYGARIMSPDFVITDSSPDTFTLGNPLKNGYDFPKTSYIPPGSSNLMGYFEVIGEERTYDHATTVSPFKVTRVTATVADVPNELMGYGYIVRVADGQSMAYNATAIANFSRNKGSLFFGISSPLPTLMDGEDTLDQLEFQLSKKEVLAGYSVEDVIAGKFSLILTFPTKHFHFCGKPNYTIKGDPTAPCPANYPGGFPFSPVSVSWDGYGYFAVIRGTGEQISLRIFDRNENVQIPPPCFLSACPPFTPPGLPWGVNVTGLYKTLPTLPQAQIRDNAAFSTVPFESGFIEVWFPNTGHVQPLNPKLTKFLHFDMLFSGYQGLPVIGLALQEYTNNNVGGFYGDTRDVFYKTKWNTE